jgi:ubiquinone/menaquinone biosynthesis C-methylase UbiE
MRNVIGTNIVAPIQKKPTQIIDVGTGMGGWVIEVAESYGCATVLGIDLSPIQPGVVPENAQFVVMDLNDGLDFDDGSTDLVHSRYVHAGIKTPQWPSYLEQILRILKPNNGWTQMIELGYPYVLSDNNSLPRDSPLSKLSQYLHDHFRVNLNMLLDGSELEKLMIDTGFVDVEARKIKLEIGDWGPG